MTAHPNKGFSVPVSEPYKVGLTAAFLHQFRVVDHFSKHGIPIKFTFTSKTLVVKKYNQIKYNNT